MTHTHARVPLLLVTLLSVPSLFVSPASAAGPAVPPDAAAVIEKHVAWLGGWEALDAVRDVTLAGTIRVSGLSGPLVVLARRDGWQRTEVDLKVMRSIETLAGRDAWERNASGQVEEMGRDKAASPRAATRRSGLPSTSTRSAGSTFAAR